MTSAHNTTSPTLAALLTDAAAQHGDRPAVVADDGSLSYAELHEQARNFGAALVDIGVVVGDTLAIWAPNSAAWITAFFGSAMARAAVVPINTRYRGREAADIINRSGASTLLTVNGFLGVDYPELLRSAGVDTPGLRTIVTTGGDATGTIVWSQFLASGGTAAFAELDRRIAAGTPDDIVDVLFTSGTTGVPKGIPSSNERTLSNARDWIAITGLSADDTYLMINPYFHLFGLHAGVVTSVVAGARMLPEATLDVDRLLRRVDEEKVSVLPGPPTLYQMILDHPRRNEYDVSSLRIGLTGAAEIPIELIRRIHADLPFKLMISAYGQTEAGTVCCTGPDDDFEAIATTVGRPRPRYEVKIVDTDGTELPRGEAGEIWVRSPNVRRSIAIEGEDPATTLDDDGWLHSGDIGMFNDAGLLQIKGRIKDMFIVGGFNVYPAELENVMLRHPDIQQVAIIGVPDDRLGEVGMAVVVPEPGHDVDIAELLAWCREEMANFKVPRHVRFVAELPMNATGKVQKQELRSTVGTTLAEAT